MNLYLSGWQWCGNIRFQCPSPSPSGNKHILCGCETLLGILFVIFMCRISRCSIVPDSSGERELSLRLKLSTYSTCSFTLKPSGIMEQFGEICLCQSSMVVLSAAASQLQGSPVQIQAGWLAAGLHSICSVSTYAWGAFLWLQPLQPLTVYAG